MPPTLQELYDHMEVNLTLPIEPLPCLEMAYEDAWQLLKDLKTQLDYMHEHWKASMMGWRWADIGQAITKQNTPVYVITNLDWVVDFYSGQKLMIKYPDQVVTPKDKDTVAAFLAPELTSILTDPPNCPLLVPRNVTIYSLGLLVLEVLHTDLDGLKLKYAYSPLYYSVYRCLTNRLLLFV